MSGRSASKVLIGVFISWVETDRGQLIRLGADGIISSREIYTGKPVTTNMHDDEQLGGIKEFIYLRSSIAAK